jgi:hypothetical protein
MPVLVPGIVKTVNIPGQGSDNDGKENVEKVNMVFFPPADTNATTGPIKVDSSKATTPSTQQSFSVHSSSGSRLYVMPTISPCCAAPANNEQLVHGASGNRLFRDYLYSHPWLEVISQDNQGLSNDCGAGLDAQSPQIRPARS